MQKYYLLSLLYFISMHGFSAPILNYYPKCDFTIIKEGIYKQKVETINSQSNNPKTIQKIFNRIQRQAKKLNADAIILTNRETVEKDRNKNKHSAHNKILKYQAQFISTCSPIILNKISPTPVDNQGNKATRVQVSTLSVNTSFTLDLNKKARPAVEFPHLDVSLNGVYGIKLGSSQLEIEERFGSPSSKFKLSDDISLLSYGRYHWFVFDNNVLSAISTQNHWFTSALTNEIPFSNDFDFMKWNILDLANQNEVLSQAQLNGQKSLQFESDDTVLTAYTLKKNSQKNDQDRKVVGYTLRLKEFDINNLTDNILFTNIAEFERPRIQLRSAPLAH